jgi:hypothetical protein
VEGGRTGHSYKEIESLNKQHSNFENNENLSAF